MLIQNRLPVCFINDKTTSGDLLQDFGFDVDAYSSIYDFITQWTPRPSCVITNTNLLGTAESHRLFEFAGNHSFLTIVLLGDAQPDHCIDCTRRHVFASIKPPYQLDHITEAIQNAFDESATNWAKHVCKEQFDRRYASLSPRESEVYEHILRGKENKLIAAQLGISSSTVEKHRLSIIRKMDVQSPIQLLLQKYVATGSIADDIPMFESADQGFAYSVPRSPPRPPATPQWGVSGRSQESLRSIN